MAHRQDKCEIYQNKGSVFTNKPTIPVVAMTRTPTQLDVAWLQHWAALRIARATNADSVTEGGGISRLRGVREYRGQFWKYHEGPSFHHLSTTADWICRHGEGSKEKSGNREFEEQHFCRG
jgi:hypothetical protein